ncbi:MAG: efflux transporter outer membrane subunit [Deltaproteobacteria bacterium]|jgi:Cu(I)/Ag(I) efflux system outer membrane protein|nr:efflux transporter outer membrane subunit [Deltaproteobacteria bacterium]
MLFSAHMRLYCWLALLSLTSCSLAPSYERPEAPVPAGIFAEQPAGAAAPEKPPGDIPELPDWRGFFTDERLRALITLSLEHNRDLKLAVLAVAEARAKYGLARAERLPMLEAEGSAAYTGMYRMPVEKRYEAALMPAFDLDLFGRLRSMSEAAFQGYLAMSEAARTARIALVAQVAQAYLEERLAGELWRLAGENLLNRRRSLDFVRQRVESGQSSLLDMEEARSMLEEATVDWSMREREQIMAVNALNFIAGQDVPEGLPPGPGLREMRLAELPGGVPSAALLRRPDILEAEHILRAAKADIGAARAAFFPSISLTGNLGYMSGELAGLFSSPNSLWAFLPSIRLPIFSGGRDAANLDMAHLAEQSALLRYEQAIRNAFKETADALQSRASLAAQLAAQERLLLSQRQVLELAQKQYINGSVSYLEVLAAQRGVFQAEQNLLLLRRDQLMNEISLYSALGGGLAAMND